MIALDAVSVLMAGRRVLGPISTQFQPGRITAVLGPNGAGKTTLLRAILGLVAYDGTITLDATSLQSIRAQSRAQRLAYLPQTSAPSWNLMTQELVMLGRAPHRRPQAAPKTADHDAVADALAATGATSFARLLIHSLSGGERARVLLARVIATQPDWLIVDEPLTHLDPLHQRNLLRLLRAQAEAGRGIIVVLHDLATAARIADAALLLRAGAVVAQGSVAKVLTAQHLKAAYDMDFEVDLARGVIGYAA